MKVEGTRGVPKRHFRPKLAPLFLLGALQAALATDPGEAWFTEGAGYGAPPVGIWWLPSASLCPVLKAKLPDALKALESRSFEALDLKMLLAYAGARCKGKYGQLPYLVRAVTAAGDGHLDAGVSHGEIWMRFAGLGGKYPFEKTPVVLWLSEPPVRVHVTVSIVE